MGVSPGESVAFLSRDGVCRLNGNVCNERREEGDLIFEGMNSEAELPWLGILLLCKAASCVERLRPSELGSTDAELCSWALDADAEPP